MSPIAPIPDVPEPGKVPRSWGLGALFENSLVRFIVQAFNRAKTGIAETLRYAVDQVLETLERPLLDMAGPVIDDLLDMPELPDSFRSMLIKARSGQHQAGIIIIGAVLVAAVQFLGPAAFSGLAEKIRQGSFNLFNPNLLDFSTWFYAAKRNPAYKGRMMQELAWQGWTEQQVQAAELVAERYPDVSELMTLWRRGDLSDGQFNQRLTALGVPSSGVAMFRNLKDLIPGPADLVRMSVREAWRDDVASAWGYDQGYVPEFGEWMQKQGYPVEWARKYWRAHWMTPSIGQGFEMMHRGEISEGQLEELLKINDLAPGWVRPMMAIARPVPGRIDRRWAFEEGEITSEELFALYKSDGYDDFWAGVLTNTVAKRALSVAKGLTRSSVERAYRKRRLSRVDALSMLGDLGIQAGVAAFYLDQVDQDRTDELLDRREDAVKKQYLAGLITEDQVYERLGALGVASDEIEADLEVWNVVLDAKVRRPSRANLDKWFRQGIVDVPGYRRQMGLLQYDGAYIDLYLASLAVERAGIAGKEERAAREEQERIRSSRIKTTYQRDKAVIDTDIAELQAAIADAQVALVAAQNERDAKVGQVLSVADVAALEREYKPLLREADAAIETARLQVAELRVDIREIEAEQNEARRSLAANRDVARQETLKAEQLALSTQIAGLARQNAGRVAEIARLQEQIPTETDAAVTAEKKQRILLLKREIAETKEVVAEKQEREQEINEALRETLSLVQRQTLEVQIAERTSEIDQVQVEVDRLRVTVQEVLAERNDLQSELQGQIEALPGRAEQIAIRLEYDSLIDEIQSRIAVFRSNIAELRISKAMLTVAHRGAQ